MNVISSIKKELRILRDLCHNRIYISPRLEKDIVREFHKLYYNSHHFSKTFTDTRWMGVPVLKCPLDLWIYQEILFNLKPDILIETGTCEGGSALYLASICDLLGKGKVITIDIEAKAGRPAHPRLEYLTGSSVDPAIVSEVKKKMGPDDQAVVFLDSNHEKSHVLKELEIYQTFVRKGSYLIVEDTNINGNPVFPAFGPGPMEALDEFLEKNKDFVIDKDKEKFYMTFSPRGYLLRIR